VNDYNIALDNLETIVSEARGARAFVERAALYGAMRALTDDLTKFVDEQRNEYGYAHENVGRVRWHLAAALGFDITNNLDESHHRSGALGAISTLRNVLKLPE
jgi:hypothetical protein